MLRLSLATAELTAEAGARVDLPVEVEALPEGFAPPPMALEEGRRTLTLPLLAKEAGTYSARVVAEGEGLRREVLFRLVVAEPRAERVALEETVYVGVPEGLSPQAWGGRWYRAPGGGLFPDRPLRAQGQGEPLFPRQWGLALAGFPEAWARGRGEGVVVAVPDTGVLKDHPDLRGALLPGLDLVDGDADPEEPVVGGRQTFHGSHVASIAAAPWNGVGLAGAGPCSASLQEAIDEARARGVLVVAAAGNQGEDYRGYFPANCRGVLAVGAVGPDGRLAPYANRGAPSWPPGATRAWARRPGSWGPASSPARGWGGATSRAPARRPPTWRGRRPSFWEWGRTRTRRREPSWQGPEGGLTASSSTCPGPSWPWKGAGWPWRWRAAWTSGPERRAPSP